VSTFIVEKYPLILSEKLIKVLDELISSVDQMGGRNLEDEHSANGDESIEEDDEEDCSPRLKGRKESRISKNVHIADRWEVAKKRRVMIKKALAESFPEIHKLIISQWFDT